MYVSELYMSGQTQHSANGSAKPLGGWAWEWGSESERETRERERERERERTLNRI